MTTSNHIHDFNTLSFSLLELSGQSLQRNVNVLKITQDHHVNIMHRNFQKI
jgi:hypothetical protein